MTSRRPEQALSPTRNLGPGTQQGLVNHSPVPELVPANTFQEFNVQLVLKSGIGVFHDILAASGCLADVCGVVCPDLVDEANDVIRALAREEIEVGSDLTGDGSDVRRHDWRSTRPKTRGDDPPQTPRLASLAAFSPATEENTEETAVSWVPQQILDQRTRRSALGVISVFSAVGGSKSYQHVRFGLKPDHLLVADQTKKLDVRVRRRQAPNVMLELAGGTYHPAVLVSGLLDHGNQPVCAFNLVERPGIEDRERVGLRPSRLCLRKPHRVLVQAVEYRNKRLPGVVL